MYGCAGLIIVTCIELSIEDNTLVDVNLLASFLDTFCWRFHIRLYTLDLFKSNVVNKHWSAPYIFCYLLNRLSESTSAKGCEVYNWYRDSSWTNSVWLPLDQEYRKNFNFTVFSPRIKDTRLWGGGGNWNFKFWTPL